MKKLIVDKCFLLFMLVGASLQALALTQSMALEVATRQANESAGILITAINNITRQFHERHAIHAGLASLPSSSSIESLSYNQSGVIQVKFKSSGVSGFLSGLVLKFRPKNDDGRNLVPTDDSSIHAWECLFIPHFHFQMKQMRVIHNIFASAHFPLQSCESGLPVLQANESAGPVITAMNHITRELDETHTIHAGSVALPPNSSVERLSYNRSGVIQVQFKSSGISEPLLGTVLTFRPKNNYGQHLAPLEDTSIHDWECLFSVNHDAKVAHRVFASADFPLQSCEPEPEESLFSADTLPIRINLYIQPHT